MEFGFSEVLGERGIEVSESCETAMGRKAGQEEQSFSCFGCLPLHPRSAIEVAQQSISFEL